MRPLRAQRLWRLAGLHGERYGFRLGGPSLGSRRAMTDPNDSLIGSLAAGRYRVLERLGEGGMGRVYLAEHVAIEKRVALKVLRTEYASKGEIVTRFQQEAISASRIKHPNVLDVFDFGQLENGCFYLAMEYLEGCDLADELTRRQVLDAATGIRVSMQICRALSAAHANGVVHRDMKPENVFLQRTADGEEIVKIVDFGIAQLRSRDHAPIEKKRRLTRTGMIFGTPEYMAPEQAGGKHADSRADIYAVGIIMYEMFTGAVPFTGDTFLGVLTKHLSETAPAMNAVYPELTISAPLQAAIMRALEKDPTVRYQSMVEFAQAISATPEATALGYRPTISSAVETSISTGARAPGTHTAQQFGPAAHAPTRAASRAAETLGSDPARADTQLGAETITPALPARSRAGLVAVSLVLLVLAAGGGLFLAKRGARTTPTPEINAAVPKALLTPVPATAATAASAEPASSAVPAPVTPASTIRLAVSSEPAGATLSKNGFQVCDSTPCEVLAAPNESLELEASKGALKGFAKVLAQRDQKVTIQLGAAIPPPKHAGPVAAPSMCEFEVEDGLKILRPCK